MTTAQLVNRILGKLRTGRVEFLVISNRPSAVRFQYGGITYTALYNEHQRIDVYRWENGSELVSLCDNYQKWMEGLLNGMVRNDAGELVPA